MAVSDLLLGEPPQTSKVRTLLYRELVLRPGTELSIAELSVLI